MRHFIFNLVGVSSVLTLLLLIVYLAPAVTAGNFDIVSRFFESNPGAEPFVIFILPVMLIGAPAWLWSRFGQKSSD